MVLREPEWDGWTSTARGYPTPSCLIAEQYGMLPATAGSQLVVCSLGMQDVFLLLCELFLSGLCFLVNALAVYNEWLRKAPFA